MSGAVYVYECGERPHFSAMNEFILVLGIASVAAFLTYLGAPIAERFDVPQPIVNAALQFAAGILTAVVALGLMPPAIRGGPTLWVVLSFVIGGAFFVFFEYYTARRMAARPASETNVKSIGLYFGILVDLVIDGIIIGIASTLTLGTGLVLALGVAVSTAPLAFVTTSTAKRQGVSRERRRLLSYLYILGIMGGALAGFVLFRNQSDGVRLVLLALASGFLITTVTQSMIPEAKRDGEPGYSGIFFLAGLSLYALLTLALT